MRKLIFVFFSAVLLSSCSKKKDITVINEQLPSLDAKFSIVVNDPVNIFEQQSIRFVNESTGYNLCSWQFGNNTKSQEVNPERSYPYHGIYTVTLTVFDDKGNRSAYSKDLSILCNFGGGVTH